MAVLLAAGTYSFAQTPATPEQRAAAEAEFGVKNVVCKYDTKAEMMADLNRTGGEYFMYSFDDVRLTPAPKGYKLCLYQSYRPSWRKVCDQRSDL